MEAHLFLSLGFLNNTMNTGYLNRFKNILKNITKKWVSSLAISEPSLLPGRDTEVQYTDAQTCSQFNKWEHVYVHTRMHTDTHTHIYTQCFQGGHLCPEHVNCSFAACRDSWVLLKLNSQSNLGWLKLLPLVLICMEDKDVTKVNQSVPTQSNVSRKCENHFSTWIR